MAENPEGMGMEPVRCTECGAELDSLGRHLPAPQPDGWRNPALAVDAVATRITSSGVLEVVMVTRGQEPWKGTLSLPGGFVDYGEDPEAAVLRELKEETTLVGRLKGYDSGILCARGDPNRDPRKHNVSIVYKVAVHPSSVPVGGDDAADAAWYPLDSLLSGEAGEVSFDHLEILKVLKQSLM